MRKFRYYFTIKDIATRITCGDDSGTLNDYLGEMIAEAGMSARVRVAPIDKYRLPFETASFDLVVFRGGLFFWERQEEIVAEMDRVLRPGGMGAHGDGFGAGASDELIESLLPEARDLNNRLCNSPHLPSSQEQRAMAEFPCAAKRLRLFPRKKSSFIHRITPLIYRYLSNFSGIPLSPEREGRVTGPAKHSVWVYWKKGG